jgi:hypothetical protein
VWGVVGWERGEGESVRGLEGAGEGMHMEDLEREGRVLAQVVVG